MITIGRIISRTKSDKNLYIDVAADFENRNVKPSLGTEAIRAILCSSKTVTEKLDTIELGKYVAILWSFNKDGNEEARDICILERAKG